MPFAELWSSSRASLALTTMLIGTELLALLITVETESISPEGLSVASSAGVLFAGVILGTYAAWVGSRFGRPALSRASSAREVVVTSVRLLAPALVIGAGAYLLGYITVMYRMYEFFVPDLALSLLALLMILGLCLGGLGLGLLLPRWLALGSSLVLFAGLQLFSLMAPGPVLSNMAGLTGCCSQDSGPNPGVVQAVVLCYLGWSLLGALAICIKSKGTPRLARRVLCVGGVVSLAVLWGGGALAAQSAGAEQEVSRTSQLRCEQPGDGHEYCFWPAEASEWELGGHNIVAGIKHLETATGISQPAVITSSRRHAEATGGLRFDFEDRYSPESVVWDLAMSLSINPSEQCLNTLEPEDGSTASEQVYPSAQDSMWEQANLLYQWWTTKADREFFDSDQGESLAALLALDEQSQRAWVQLAAEGIKSCHVVELPGN